jgi:bifunctional DNase/RNase
MQLYIPSVEQANARHQASLQEDCFSWRAASLQCKEGNPHSFLVGRWEARLKVLRQTRPEIPVNQPDIPHNHSLSSSLAEKGVVGRDERETAVPVLMELKRIIINEIHDQQIIMLHEVDGERAFPIVIGLFEALSIDRRIKGVVWPRPMTHDLICTVVDHLGGDLQDVYINELREHTYFARLRVRKDGELVEVDCRPSDAIAVAVTAKVPIYVAEDVIEEASEEQ